MVRRRVNLPELSAVRWDRPWWLLGLLLKLLTWLLPPSDDETQP